MSGALVPNGLLHDGLAYWTRRYPDKIAARMDDEDEISYRDLDCWSDAIAARLQATGVVAGDNVALAAANCLEWVASAFAILKVGGTIAPFNDRLVSEELHYLAEATQPCLIIGDAARLAALEGAVPGVLRMTLDAVAKLRTLEPEPYRPVRVEPDAIAMIIYTSGSTSRPKGAMMSHASYLAKFFEMQMLDDRIGRSIRAMMPFGLHSSPGLPWGILFATVLGGTLYFTRKFKADRVLKTLVEQKITSMIGVPVVYDQIGQLPEFETANLSAMNFARIGGATPNPVTLARWREKGVIVRGLYGMTEMGGGSLVSTEEEALAHPESCGRGLSMTRIRILRDDGTPCGRGEAGHVLLKGPGMMTGYWNDPVGTEAALQDGWMHTGDIGSLDSEGYFRFVDRSKEMIKSGGYNVSPAEVEQVLLEMGGVVEVAVFAVPDARFGEAVCACIRTQVMTDEREIFDHCATRLAGYKLPRFIVFMEEPLPRLANEKMDRRRLKQIYADIGADNKRMSSGAM